MNIAIITGNLGKDATVKQVGEKYVIDFSIATTEKYGEKTITDWHDCKYWVKSDKIAQYLKKGTKLAITGKNKTDSYEKDEQKRYIKYILVNQLEFMSKSENSNSEQNNDDNSNDLPF